MEFQYSTVTKIFLTNEKKAFLNDPHYLWILLISTTLDFMKYFNHEWNLGNRYTQLQQNIQDFLLDVWRLLRPFNFTSDQ